MKHAEKVTPIAGAVSADTTLACCLPISFAAAAAIGSVGAVVASYREWFLVTSVGLVAVGGLQLARARRRCATQGYAAPLIWAGSAGVVALVVFFPQVVAGLLADWMP